MDYRVLNGRLLDTLLVEWSLRSLPLVSLSRSSALPLGADVDLPSPHCTFLRLSYAPSPTFSLPHPPYSHLTLPTRISPSLPASSRHSLASTSRLAPPDLGWRGLCHWSHSHGAPRVFNPASASLYNSLFGGEAGQRTVANEDSVPTIIPESDDYTFTLEGFHIYGTNSTYGMSVSCWCRRSTRSLGERGADPPSFPTVHRLPGRPYRPRVRWWRRGYRFALLLHSCTST